LVKPYTESYDNGLIIREFKEDVDSEELVWHRDKRTREITILEGKGWQLQLDNQLPKELKQGHLYTIPEMEYHRLIKGTGKLVVKIWEETHD
jgi:quercetin dioxygenase-like cupin family protein|tara:strand:+ start:210 stop:485 length:276 start_codon:yes stop_codon:yes gene_type:complete